MDYREEKEYVGHTSQLFKIMKVKMEEGKAKGAELLDVMNSSGLQFDINISRGMDIPYLNYKGNNIGFISPCGVVAPEYFDDKELGFLKSFTAGFLTTCGLKTIGSPSVYEGQAYGLHGNISNTPASNFSYQFVEKENGSVYLDISGCVEDAVIFGDKLSLRRNLRCYYKEKKITISDRVTNEGYKKARHMILYHFNIGYPVLSPDSEIYIPSLKAVPRDEHAGTGIHKWMTAEKADPGYQEMCYYHTLAPDKDNHATAAIFNPVINTGIAIEMDLSTLDHFVQWKMMGSKDYVMGFEPANSTIDGIGDAENNGKMKYLDALEAVEYHLSFSILDSREEFEAIKQKQQGKDDLSWQQKN